MADTPVSFLSNAALSHPWVIRLPIADFGATRKKPRRRSFGAKKFAAYAGKELQLMPGKVAAYAVKVAAYGGTHN